MDKAKEVIDHYSELLSPSDTAKGEVISVTAGSPAARRRRAQLRVTSAEFVRGLSAKLARGLAGGKQELVELKVTPAPKLSQMSEAAAEAGGRNDPPPVAEKLVVRTESLRLRTPRPPPAANQLCDEKVCAALEIESAALWMPAASASEATHLRVKSTLFPESTAIAVHNFPVDSRPLFRIHSSLAPCPSDLSARSQSLRANPRSLYRKPRFHVVASASALVKNPLQNDTHSDSKLLPALL